jgi:hypothetical protein
MPGVARGLLDHVNKHPTHGHGISEPCCADVVHGEVIGEQAGRLATHNCLDL